MDPHCPQPRSWVNPFTSSTLTFDHVEPGLGERLGAHVAADGHPLMPLLARHHPNQATHRGAVRRHDSVKGPSSTMVITSSSWGRVHTPHAALELS